MGTKRSFYSKALFCAFVSFFIILGSSYSFGYQWEKTLPAGDNLRHYYGSSVQQTTDGGFIIAGLTDLGESDAVYLIYYKPPITVTSPNGGEELSAGENFEIIWTSDVDIDFVKIEYSVNSGSGWMEIVASTEKDGSYLWEVL